MLLGLAVHDTSQAVGAGLTYAQCFGEDVALKVAALTKLTRNLCLAAVIPGISYAVAKVEGGGGDGARLKFSQCVPSFVIGFAAMALLRTAGDASLVARCVLHAV